VEVIPPYQTLTDEMLSVRSMRACEVPPGAVRTIEALKKQGLDSIALPRQVITESMLVPEASCDRFFGDYGPIRFPLPIDHATARLDVFHPNALVDVFFTYTSRDAPGKENVSTDRILTGVKVSSIQASPNTGMSLRVEVERREMVFLRMANEMGSITLALASNDQEDSHVNPDSGQRAVTSPEKSRQAVLRILPEGMRTISVGAVASGEIRPGDCVDVYRTRNSGGSETRTFKDKLLLEDIEVFALEKAPPEDELPRGLKRVSLLIKPDQAERLKLDHRQDSLRLSVEADK
jgi:Flp pilus assembly protein CpaB